MTFKPRSFTEAKASYRPLKSKGFNRRAPEGANSRPVADQGPTSTGKPRKMSLAKRGKRQSRLRAKPDANLAAWGRRARMRDGNRCQWIKECVTGDRQIDPHHIAPRSQRPDLIYVDSNAICLCRQHHQWVHDHPISAQAMGLLSDRTRELAAKENTLGER